MTLDSIYRSINSLLTSRNVNVERIVHKDIINAINDAIASKRLEYIANGLGDQFSITERIFVLTKDQEYPFLYSYCLDEPILQSLPIQQAVKNTNFFRSSNEIKNEAQSWSKGDLALKDGILYKALSDVDNTNTFDLTFKSTRVRSFVGGSGMNYKTGDLIYDGGTYYLVNEDVIVTTETEVTDLNVTELIWQEVCDGFIDATFVPFSRINELKLKKNIDTVFFTIYNDTIYTTQNTICSINYIPEWTYIEKLDDKVNIPDSMVDDIKMMVVQLLISKLGGGSSE
jgi:hypothetical protein